MKAKIKSAIHGFPNENADLNQIQCHETSPLQLHDLVLHGANFYENTTDAITELSRNKANIKLLQGEHFPRFYDSNPRTLDFLRLLVEHSLPEVIVETGIANGASTRVWLNAIQEFKLEKSKLYSFDIDQKFVAEDMRSNPSFNFRLIDDVNTFTSLVSELEAVDIFYHDSDHSYFNQIMEYRSIWPKIRKGGFLVSDDINWSNAFLDFVKEVGRIPLIVADTEKFCGVIVK